MSLKKTFLTLSIASSLLITSSLLFAGPSTEALQRQLDSFKILLDQNMAKLAENSNSLIELRQNLSTLKGAVENSDYNSKNQSTSIQNYEQRISAMEERINVLMTLFEEIKQGTKAVKVDEAQNKEFQALLNLVSAEDYSKAISGFQAFQKKYPKSPLLENAQYWIAESQFSLRDFKTAINEFQNLIKLYPKSSKVKTALLKQGLSFVSLGMPTEALAFFQKVNSDFPNTLEASRAQAQIKEIEKKQGSSSSPSPSEPSAAPFSGGF